MMTEVSFGITFIALFLTAMAFTFYFVITADYEIARMSFEI